MDSTNQATYQWGGRIIIRHSWLENLYFVIYSSGYVVCQVVVLAKRIGTIYEDVTTEVLGNVGIWQWFVVILSTVLTMPSLFNGHEDMFLLKSAKEVTCIPPERYEVANASLCTVNSINNSTDQLRCTRWQIKLFWLIWLKKSWHVFCDDKIRLLSTAMICRMGLMFGCVMFGLIADNVGRKIALLVDIFAQLVLGAIITFCDSQAWFQLLVFLKSLFGGATIYVGLLLGTELFVRESDSHLAGFLYDGGLCPAVGQLQAVACEVASNMWRSRFIAFASTPRLLAIACMVPLANALPNLETLFALATIYSLFILIIMRWTPESPQWLLFNRRIHVAEKSLYNAAMKNGIKLCSEFKIRPVNHRAYNSLDETRTCAEIFTTYNIRVIILVTLLMWCLFWFQWSYLYARVFIENATHLQSTLLCSIVIFSVLTMLLSKKLTLRHLLLFNIVLSGISAFVEIVFGHTAPHLFSSIALASGIVVHALLLNITPRLFAIRIRATLLGCCHAIGQLGTIAGYLMFVFQPLSNVMYVAVDVAITLALSTLTFVLLDVDGRELPDMIDDMDYFSELSKPLRWATQKTDSTSYEEVEMRIHSFGSGAGHVSHHTVERLPARKIGFKFWRYLTEKFRRMFQERVFTKYTLWGRR